MMALAITPLTTYAESGSSGSGAYGALLTPDTTPPAGWAEDESNPYGTKKGQPFAITPWYEPIIYSYRNAEGQAAQDHTKVYDKLTLGKNIIESPSGTYSISSVDNVAFAVGTAQRQGASRWNSSGGGHAFGILTRLLGTTITGRGGALSPPVVLGSMDIL